MITRKFSLLGARIAAAIVVLITSVVLVNATMTISVPNAVTYSYSLSPGLQFNVLVPTIDRPVHLMGTCITPGFRGAGHVTLLRAGATPALLMWAGLETEGSAGPSIITSGWTAGGTGTHILYLDYGRQCDVEVLGTTAIRVNNGAASHRVGWITMIW